MADVQHARYGRLFQALFGLKQALTLGQALPDIQGSIDIEHPRPEMEVYSGNNLCSGYGFPGAVALQLPAVVLSVPVGSGVIATVEGITVVSTIGQYVVCGITTGTGFGTVTPAVEFRDFRRVIIGNAAMPTAQVRYGNSVGGIGTGAFITYCPALTPVTIDYPAVIGDTKVIAPAGTNNAFGVVGGTVNTALAVSLTWRERRAEPQELQLL